MIQFQYYKGTSPDVQREQVARHVCIKLQEHLDLPEIIEIQFVHLGPSTYGETIVDTRYPNRIRINLDLSLTEIVIPIVHELIHLEQIKQGRLSNTRFGDILWEGKKYSMDKNMAYREYMKLPWEMDVSVRQPKLLSKILKT
jgi:hypothetical protein